MALVESGKLVLEEDKYDLGREVEVEPLKTSVRHLCPDSCEDYSGHRDQTGQVLLAKLHNILAPLGLSHGSGLSNIGAGSTWMNKNLLSWVVEHYGSDCGAIKFTREDVDALLTEKITPKNKTFCCISLLQEMLIREKEQELNSIIMTQELHCLTREICKRIR
ncbi:hypothetical protein L1987_57510 [Smallanthus sonchifolius]|uniref:Uncharacterized protein n=1 Tax=Smallanthus sonchifolius TaxID=185202 RepID=A0ACB9DDB6_9ASTR|nr:hypothetical protein L1987_57510 [Smallanthus sonchifolius]